MMISFTSCRFKSQSIIMSLLARRPSLVLRNTHAILLATNSFNSHLFENVFTSTLGYFLLSTKFWVHYFLCFVCLFSKMSPIVFWWESMIFPRLWYVPTTPCYLKEYLWVSAVWLGRVFFLCTCPASGLLCFLDL